MRSVAGWKNQETERFGSYHARCETINDKDKTSSDTSEEYIEP